MDRRPSYGLGFSGLRRFWLQGPDLESRRRKLDPSCDFRMTRLPLTQAIFPIQGAEASSMGWRPHPWGGVIPLSLGLPAYFCAGLAPSG